MQVKYTINDLERLSGIKAHTIRIWEQRYNLLTPSRGGRNIRSYSNDELRKLLNVNFLGQCGYKISEIASLSDDELKAKLSSIINSKFNNTCDYINMLIVAMIDLDEDKFTNVINESVRNSDFELCIKNVVFPFLRKIGVMWQAGDVNPVQEHFICNLIRQKIIVQIDQVKLKLKSDFGTFLLYLPEGEWHELSLLYYAYLLKKLGVKCIYLGQSVPYENIVNVIDQYKPKYLITIITTPLIEGQLSEYLANLSYIMQHGEVFLSGFQLLKEDLTLPANVKLFSDSNFFYDLLKDNK